MAKALVTNIYCFDDPDTVRARMIKKNPLSYYLLKNTPIILFVWLCAVQESTAFQALRPSSSSRLAPQIRQYTSASFNFGLNTRGRPSKSIPASILPKRNMAISSDSEPSSPKPQQNRGIFRTVFDAVGSTTSIVVSGTYFVVLAYQRDALMVSFFIGSISNAVLGKVMKKILNQERPQDLNTEHLVVKPSDGGMPSSHAMSLGFIGTFTGLTLPWTQVPILVYSAVSLAYRVTTKLHTWEQISVGFVLGSTNGAIWRHLCDGRNPFHINIMDMVSTTLLSEVGVLPWPYLAVPALVGAIVVGSVERRISGWYKKIKGE